MRRLVPALVAAALALATPATGAPRNGITDPKGDWPVPAHDVLTAKLTSAYAGRTPVLRAELQLAGAPVEGAPAAYAVGFSIGCHAYYFEHSWAAEGYHTALSYDDFCVARTEAVKVGPDRELPAKVTISGSTVRWEAPYTGHIKRGAKVEGMYAWGCPRMCTGVGVNWDDTMFVTGDLAYGTISYVVGSDLPRR